METKGQNQEAKSSENPRRFTRKELEKISHLKKRAFPFFLLCIGLLLILPTAYEAECSNYNRRVLGYHLSLMNKEKSDKRESSEPKGDSTISKTGNTWIINECCCNGKTADGKVCTQNRDKMKNKAK
jgi:hypothetical protein